MNQNHFNAYRILKSIDVDVRSRSIPIEHVSNSVGIAQKIQLRSWLRNLDYRMKLI